MEIHNGLDLPLGRSFLFDYFKNLFDLNINRMYNISKKGGKYNDCIEEIQKEKMEDFRN